ncbi:dicarboxylate/amino acid:cation symporter [Saccharicrinis fermentans]|uniref:Glutamate-aspartate carrier protein n=1 Tax=Saccharicrinis fermentans DSM 9555 = JCM 21142 TaxID=869213 RepID=W7YJ78_9BACT|nr:dicarboxylate/amino acid:cation symporter [Saccharicrinis fermentans]GAF04551.1 glutamate-aspartate carrier protein [Saccharicrinis fermentans DSM 9555 = JCM 21142]
MKNVPLYLQIIAGIVLGAIWAILSGYLGWQGFTSDWIDPFGKIFIKLLKLIAIPLILFSIISGIVSLGNPKDLGRLGVRTLGLYLLTTVVAVSLGLVLVNTFKPGKALSDEVRLENRIAYELWADNNQIEIKDGLRFSDSPENKDIVKVKEALLQIERENEIVDKLKPKKKQGPLQALVDLVPENAFNAIAGNGSMLQIIFFAIFFGIALLYIPADKSRTIIQFVDGASEVFIKMVDIIMKGAPFFVFALMAGVVNDIAGDNPAKIVEIFKGLGWYSLTVLIGLLLMAFAIYPGVLKLLVPKRKFFEFLRGISPAQALAFSTSSSAATLPVTFECVEENLGVDKKTAGFVLPIGATVNMDGTSLYQAVAVLFLAQLHMIDLTLGQQITVVLTATLASIGSAAIPSAGIVMLMVVLQSVGLNPAWIAIILPVDRILDMVRTTVNVTGDASVSVIIDQYVSEES